MRSPPIWRVISARIEKEATTEGLCWARAGLTSSRAGEQSKARRSMGEGLSKLANMECYNITIFGSVKALPWSHHAAALRLPS
jgi:hypothetical protein